VGECGGEDGGFGWWVGWWEGCFVAVVCAFCGGEAREDWGDVFEGLMCA